MLRDKSLSDFLEADQYIDKYISVSQLATDYVVEKYGLERTKIITIPNGLILEEHFERLNQQPAARSNFGVSEDDYLFLNVASYNLHKAHYLMADAMRLVLRKRDDIKIICVGNVIYPPHIEQLRADIEGWGLTNHILMPGYIDDVSPLHKMADAFLLPSLIEGWSIAMNEAMFYGKPMILTETGGAPQVINDSDIGLLIPNEYGPVSNLDSFVLDRIGYEQRNFQTAPFLANAMIQFADNKEAWKKKGMAGHHKIVNDYDFSAVTEKYVSVCLEVLQC
jgi:glycosyltransferase involved in cell wall biosynthesis